MNSNEIELDTFSYVHSLPGSKHQPWHQDVKHLFEHHKKEEKNNKNKEDQDWKWVLLVSHVEFQKQVKSMP